MHDPSNYTPGPQTGLSFASESLDAMPHLAVLVSEGELIHEDIVLPSVLYPNRAVTKHWMAFCERHPEEIVFAYGECNPGPSHLKFWFAEEGKPPIEQLIEELKEIGAQEEPTTNSTLLSEAAPRAAPSER